MAADQRIEQHRRSHQRSPSALPAASTRPTMSPPATCGEVSGTPGMPRRTKISRWLRAQARTRTRSSPLPGSRRSISPYSNASGPPCDVQDRGPHRRGGRSATSSPPARIPWSPGSGATSSAARCAATVRSSLFVPVTGSPRRRTPDADGRRRAHGSGRSASPRPRRARGFASLPMRREREPLTGCGAATTQTSSTFGCSSRIVSTSFGYTFSPPTLIRSSTRPEK